MDDKNREGANWRHYVLFFLTLVSTTIAGSGFGWEVADVWTDPSVLVHGLWFSIPLLTILMAHEMGHYLTALHHDVESTPPFFLPGIPIPGVGVIPFIGTFGAFIRMDIRKVTPNQLLSIGAWGPVAGFIVAFPVLMVGFYLSEVHPLPEDVDSAITLGDSLFLLLGEAIFHPNIPEGHDVFLHPMAMAGWVGGFLTALNLVPLGQLDGGHIAYATFGERYNRVAPLVFAGLIVLGIVWFPGWIVIAVFVLIMGIKHPPVTTEGIAQRPWLTWVCLIIFVLTFAPAPIEGISMLTWFE